MTAISLAAARVSFAAAAAFVVLLVGLHILKPDLDPSWRMGSEYAIGDYGWVMTIALFSIALSCVALFAALRSEIETVGGRIALGLLLVVAAALAVGGIFVVDPVTTKPEDMTTHGVIHSVAGAVFTFSLKGGYEAGVNLVSNLKLFSHLANVGDTRSLVIHPASTTHSQLDDAAKVKSGAAPDVVRLSIGIEDKEDLIADLEQALGA